MRLFVFIILCSLMISCSEQKDTGEDVISTASTAEGSLDSSKVLSPNETSIIKCPYCGYKKKEQLPTDVCLISYDCDNCKKTLHPREGDCCVFCTYGDHKCPSKQEE